MEIRRGEIWWADLGDPRGSEPGFRRPVLVVQADDFNRSRISTILTVVLTRNLRLAAAPGNVLIPHGKSGLKEDSVANVSQFITVDRGYLDGYAGRISPGLMAAVDAGMKLILGLP